MAAKKNFGGHKILKVAKNNDFGVVGWFCCSSEQKTLFECNLESSLLWNFFIGRGIIVQISQEWTKTFGKWSNWKLRKYAYLRKFLFDHFPKSKIDSEADLKWECPFFYSKFFCWRVLVTTKWMDRPSVTEMDRQTKCQKMDMPLKWIKFY